MLWQAKMAQFLTIGRHFDCAIQTELVVELELALTYVRKIYERVHVGWHCAKVKGHAELKIEKPRVKTLSYDFPNYTIPTRTVSAVTST